MSPHVGTSADRTRLVLERVGLILCGCALEWLTAPPGPAPALIFVQDVPFLLLLWHRGGRGWAWWAWIYAFAKFVVGLHWLSEVHWTMAVSAPFVLAFAYLLWGATIRAAVRRGAPWIVTVAVTAALEEMLQAVIQVSSGMPWPARSLAYAAWPGFVGFTAYFGAYGLSALGAATSAWASGVPSLFLAADAYHLERARRLATSGLGLGLVVALAWGLGTYHTAMIQGRIEGSAAIAAKTAPLVVIQANVGQSLKNDRQDPRSAQEILDDHLRLTRDALAVLRDQRRDVLAVLWPETMVPWPFLSPGLARRFPNEGRDERMELWNLRTTIPAGLDPTSWPRFLLGVTYHFEGRSGPHEKLVDHDQTDAVVFVDPTKIPAEPPGPADAPDDARPWFLPPGRHDKVVLVPWGEYTPGGTLFPFLRPLRAKLSVIPEITPGDPEQEPFLLAYAPPEVKGTASRRVLAGTIICFEIAFPARCRAWRLKGATVLLNPGNYAWYGDTEMPDQVLALGKLRAAELGMTVVIAGNSGPTCFIDPSGALRDEVRSQGRTRFVEGWCASPLWCDPGYFTPYSRWGDTPFAVASFLLVGVTLLRWRAARRAAR